MNILVIAPHGDDEVLGCGGTIDKYVKLGYQVDICIVSDPYEPIWTKSYIEERNRVIENIKKVLGIHNIYRLKFKAANLHSEMHFEINSKILELINDIKPNIIFIPYEYDIHQDHKIVSQSCRVSTRPTSNIVNKIYEYEVLSETEWGVKPFEPNVYIKLNEENLKKKLEAMKCYKMELYQAPHPRSLRVIEAQCIKRGSEINVNYAEAFKLMREII